MKKKTAEIKQYLKYLYVFLALIASYLVFAMLSCLLPNSKIHKNITNTVERGDLRTDYPMMGIPLEQCQQDNFTDALILSQAWYCSSDSMLTSVLLLPRAYGPNPYVMSDCLWRQVHGEDYGTRYYARYWHGNTFAMRFLLLLGSYQTVRMILYIITMLLFVALCLSLGRRGHSWVAILLAVSLGMVYSFVAQISMQLAPVLIIALGAALFVCRRRNDDKSIPLLMFVTGSLTAFMDLFTTPLLTLALPLALWLVLASPNLAHKSWLSAMISVAGKAFLWGIGYAATWLFKWLIATLFTPNNIFSDAVAAAAIRSGTEDYSRWDAVVQNLNMVHWGLLAIVLLLLLFFAILRFRKQNVKTATMLMILGFMPIVWYFIVSNHSYVHWWFTYRLLMVSILSWMLAVGVLVDWRALAPRRLRRQKNKQ